MNFEFFTLKFLALILLVSSNANAGLITHNGYTLDEETNIVTKGNLEWLQWDATKGKSITEALGEYEQTGWELATNGDISNLYRDFGWNATSDDGSGAITDSPYTVDDTTFFDSFLELFGTTVFNDTAGYGSGVNALQGVFVYYGSDSDNDEKFKLASVHSDYDVNASRYGNRAVIYGDHASSSDKYESYGIALIRRVEVPEPSTLAIFALGMMGLVLRQFKKQS
ncbi:PEP-CTERM sorting domain-containing protein [Colwellia sp. 1_MG-2023]|uniref:PEP-CTERM sorting domain-containing protein n=1 Tax=Colwellia sp. 1_MG-2023 TaxID=3062649 RepID=UPI0026E3DB0A|nr:PEP-CTERM sorting domain-containing protein [Colwellia sp. 1_MG-2023]MDO6447550.1 PEP-CTERM sorting domain-containing protein [Colwellia sp. 1_MG-2023]